VGRGGARRITKCFFSKHIILTAVVLLCKENDVESFLFVLHQPDTLFTNLSDILKKEEVRVMNIQREVKVAYLSQRNKVSNNSGGNHSTFVGGAWWSL
jgi:hypothetical protein